MRIPVGLEVDDQRRTEMAIRLFQRVGGHVCLKQAWRLLPYPHRPAVAGCAHHARSDQCGHGSLNGGVPFAPGDYLRTKEPALRALDREPTVEEDALAGEPVPDDAWEAQIRRPGDYP